MIQKTMKIRKTRKTMKSRITRRTRKTREKLKKMARFQMPQIWIGDTPNESEQVSTAIQPFKTFSKSKSLDNPFGEGATQFQHGAVLRRMPPPIVQYTPSLWHLNRMFLRTYFFEHIPEIENWMPRHKIKRSHIFGWKSIYKVHVLYYCFLTGKK